MVTGERGLHLSVVVLTVLNVLYPVEKFDRKLIQLIFVVNIKSS